MIYQINPEDLLYLDIETAPQYPKYEDAPEGLQKFWNKKATKHMTDEQTPSEVYNCAGLYAEFGRIICISMGKIVQQGGEYIYRVKSYANDDERKLLQEFINDLENFYRNGIHTICAHNGNEFDIPFIARRMLILGLKLPTMLNIAGLKPWELKDRLIDTMQLWKFGDFKNFTSLALLCEVFNIPTPKDDIDGSEVYRVYYEENNLDRIVTYCEKDTLAVANLVLRLQGKPVIMPEKMQVVG
ncbi:MAG: ribonuclease H-like domain-containing protein [Mangrovibacterium sp.]